MAPMTLGYWNIRGWGAPVRMLLTYTEAPFQEDQYELTVDESGPEPKFGSHGWGEKKYNLGLEFPNLPYLIDGDFKLTQSIAIMRYIGKKHGLAGENIKEDAVIDMVADQINEFRDSLYSIAYEKNFTELREQKLEGFKKQVKLLDTYLTGKDFALGPKVTWVDFLLVEVLDFAAAFLSNELVMSHANLKNFSQRMKKLPQLKPYVESKEAKWPFCAKVAFFGGGWRSED